MSAIIEFPLRGEHITLDALLKATGLADSGGAAKQLIAQEQVSVNGAIEVRRGRKVRGGDRVQLGDAEVLLLAAPEAAPRSGPVKGQLSG